MRSRFAPMHPTSSPPHERTDDMKRIIAAGAALALLLPAAATLAQQPAKGKEAPPKGAATTPAAGAASTGKTLYPQGQFDLMLKERLAQDRPRPGRKRGRGEGGDRGAAKRREVRRSLQGRRKGTGIEGQGRRSRLERSGQLRQAVRRRHEEDAEGKTLGATRAEAIRLAC